MRKVLTGLHFDRLINVALLVAVIYGITIARPSITTRAAPAYVAGEKAPSVPGADFGASEKTLVMFLRSTCVFCTESMPFYRTLVEGRGPDSSRVRFVGVTSEDKATFDSYLGGHQLALDLAVSTDLRPWSKVTGTPTIVLINREGVIEQAWGGRLSEVQEETVRQALALK